MYLGSQEMEKSIGEADAKAAALSAQQAELDSQAGAVREQCERLKEEQEEESAAVAQLTDSKCQVSVPPLPHSSAAGNAAARS